MSELTYKQQLVLTLVGNPEFVSRCCDSYDRKRAWFCVSREVDALVNELGNIDKTTNQIRGELWKQN